MGESMMKLYSSLQFNVDMSLIKVLLVVESIAIVTPALTRMT